MKETKFLRAMGEIDDAFLLEAEKAEPRRRATLHSSRRMAALVAALITVLLAVSVSAAYVVTHWDQIFLDRFAPTEAAMRQSEEAVQAVSAISQCGDVTLSVNQTLGDTTSLYLNLEIRLPESIDLRDYAVLDEESGEYYSSIWPEDVQLYYRAASYEELRGLSPEETDAWFGESSYPSGMVSIENYEVDPESNTLHFLVGFFDDSNQITGGDISLVVGSLASENEDGYEMLLTGPFVVSWRAENHGEVYHYALQKDGERVGSATLSGFSLKIHLESSDYEDCEALMDLVKIVYRDGSTARPAGSCSASFTDPPGAIDLSWQFDEILLLEDVETIEIADYICKQN